MSNRDTDTKKSIMSIFKKNTSGSSTTSPLVLKSDYQAIDHDTDHDDTGAEDNIELEAKKEYIIQINDEPVLTPPEPKPTTPPDGFTVLRPYSIGITQLTVNSDDTPRFNTNTSLGTRKSEIVVDDRDDTDTKYSHDSFTLNDDEDALNMTHFSKEFSNTGELYREWKKYEGFVEKRIQELATIKPQKQLLQQILDIDAIITTNQRSLRQNKLIDPSKKAWQTKLNWYPQKQLYPLIEDISNLYRDLGDIPHISYTPSMRLITSVKSDLKRINSKFDRKWNKPAINRIKSTMFDRECTKYWVKNENLLKVICAILPNLPIYRHPLSPKDTSMAQMISSVYMDDDDCKCYHERINKEEDARVVRVRWYGQNKSICFVERKIHKKGDQQSLKERFRMKDEEMAQFMEGADLYDAKINKGTAMKRLQEEVSEMIQVFGLMPKTRIVYNRISFQQDTTNVIRISLDSDLKFVRENSSLLDNDKWFTEDEMIGADDVVEFPFNVLELKLCGKYIDEPPKWIQDLMDSDLLMKCYKFSKYGQSIYSFFANDIYITPRWIEEYPQYFDEEYEEEEDDKPKEAVAAKKWICCKCCSKDKEEIKGKKKKKLMNPKVYFSNERTFLQWFQAAVFVGSAGLTILSMNPSDISGPLLIAVSFLVLLWAVSTYYWRNYRLLRNVQEGLHDLYGPMVLVSVMIFVMGYSLKNGVNLDL